MTVPREIELMPLTRGEAQQAAALQYDSGLEVQVTQEGQLPLEEEKEEEQQQQQQQPQLQQHQRFQFLLQLIQEVQQQREEGVDLENADRMTHSIDLMCLNLEHFRTNRQVMIATKGPIKSIATVADFNRHRTPVEVFEEERLRRLRKESTRVANDLLDSTTETIKQWIRDNLRDIPQCAKYFEVLLKALLSSQRDLHGAVENVSQQEVETFKVPILRLCAEFLELAKSNYELELACVFHDLSIIVVRLEEAKVPELLQKKFAAHRNNYSTMYRSLLSHMVSRLRIPHRSNGGSTLFSFGALLVYYLGTPERPEGNLPSLTRVSDFTLTGINNFFSQKGMTASGIILAGLSFVLVDSFLTSIFLHRMTIIVEEGVSWMSHRSESEYIQSHLKKMTQLQSGRDKELTRVLSKFSSYSQWTRSTRLFSLRYKVRTGELKKQFLTIACHSLLVAICYQILKLCLFTQD